MTTKERADAISKRLTEQNLMNLNLTYVKVNGLPTTEEVCDFLEAYLDGRCKKIDSIEETPLPLGE